jgi:hypothetical protein
MRGKDQSDVRPRQTRLEGGVCVLTPGVLPAGNLEEALDVGDLLRL